MKRSAPGGMGIFTLIWFGQSISIIGSGLTFFALGVWVFQQTEQATAYALVALFSILPSIVISPLAGPLVDRWNRRAVILLSDLGSALVTLIIALLFYTGAVELWHIYLTAFASATFSAFQWPAYSAATTMLVRKDQYDRASGMLQLAQAMGQMVSPLLAGFLIVKIQVWGVILIDFATFLFAVLTLLLVHIPQPEPTAEVEGGKGSLLREFAYGWSYLAQRRGLMGMLILFAILNFLMGFVNALFTPMMLSITSPNVLGVVTFIAGLGMMFGGMAMSIGGGLKRRIDGVLGFLLLGGLAFIVGGLRPSVPLVGAAAFGFFFCVPIISASSQAIWQRKVAPDVQGRVFATRTMVATAAMPVAYLVVGPLADQVFEPLLAVDGPLADSVGRIIGVGPGRGMGLLFIVLGALTMLTALAGYLHPRIRRVEEELPDAIVEEDEEDEASGPAAGGMGGDSE